MPEMLDSASGLLKAVAAFYRTAGRSGEPAAGLMIERACSTLAGLVSQGPPAEPPASPRYLPMADLLFPALERISTPALSPLAVAIRDVAASFHWRQNPNYTAANMGAAFMAGYGYAEFAGPKEALCHVEAVRVGLLVLGPGLHYPPHAHPAEEVYYPLTDGGRWRRGGEPWRDVAAGVAIHHPSKIAHETRAGPSTLLALYCWAGDTATEARLTT